MGKAFSEITKPFGLDKALHELDKSVLRDGLDAVTGAGDARKAAAAAAQQAREFQEATVKAANDAAAAQRNMQANFAADLSNAGKATVVAGGTADDVASATDIAKKRRLGTNFASSLGLNT